MTLPDFQAYLGYSLDALAIAVVCGAGVVIWAFFAKR